MKRHYFQLQTERNHQSNTINKQPEMLDTFPRENMRETIQSTEFNISDDEYASIDRGGSHIFKSSRFQVRRIC